MKELRVGLVLFGGVALAVYINGIVTELWRLLRASRALQGGDGDGEPNGTEAIYRDLLERLQQTPGAQPLCIAVDAVAGTSAGGVNGGVLAKAVVDGGDAAILNRVWIEKADFSLLRREPGRPPFWFRSLSWVGERLGPLKALRHKVDGLPGLNWGWVRDSLYTLVTTSDGRVTPLDGSYFARMIAETYRDMGSGTPLLQPNGTFDLFLTRTDLHGWPRHLPVSRSFHPRPLYERTHAHVMTFRHRPRAELPSDDFGLTFATRTTAGFPGAFAPVAYRDVVEDYGAACPGLAPTPRKDFARRHLREHELAGFPVERAWMIDGGVLDNKPFSHVARAIEDKPAEREVVRAVVYVEPDPEVEVAPAAGDLPAPLNVLGGLYGLFRHEPILGDLRDLAGRNDKVERLRAQAEADRPVALSAAEAAGRASGLAWPPRLADLDAWRRVTNEGASRAPLAGYAGYVQLKARRAASVAAAAICEALDYPYDSRHAYFVRVLVRRWLERAGALAAPVFEAQGGEAAGGHRLAPAQLELLEAFDLPFRLRRLRALVQSVNRFYGEGPPEARAALDRCKAALSDIAFGYESARSQAGIVRSHLETALGGISSDAIDQFIARLEGDPEAVIADHDDVLRSAYAALRTHFASAAEAQNGRLAEALALLPREVQGEVAQTLVAFPFLDLALFPAMDAAGVADLITVEAMRISPADATCLSGDPQRLKSRGLGAFAGFLDRHAREHDLMWGRLDGAERLLELVLSAAAVGGPTSTEIASLRREFLPRLVEAILREEEARPGSSLGDDIRALRDKLAAGPDSGLRFG